MTSFVREFIEKNTAKMQLIINNKVRNYYTRFVIFSKVLGGDLLINGEILCWSRRRGLNPRACHGQTSDEEGHLLHEVAVTDGRGRQAKRKDKHDTTRGDRREKVEEPEDDPAQDRVFG